MKQRAIRVLRWFFRLRWEERNRVVPGLVSKRPVDRRTPVDRQATDRIGSIPLSDRQHTDDIGPDTRDPKEMGE